MERLRGGEMDRGGRCVMDRLKERWRTGGKKGWCVMERQRDEGWWCDGGMEGGWCCRALIVPVRAGFPLVSSKTGYIFA